MIMTNHRLRITALLLAALLLAACGPKVRLDKLDANAVVLAFGDSLTFGTGAAAGESYPAVLERNIGRKVVNAGVPGETSAQGLERLPRVLEETQPNLLILCHGGNDFLQRLEEAKAAQNIRAMIQLARAKGIAVLLVATPKPGLPPSVPAFYGEIATASSIPLEDAVIRSVLFDNSLKSDMIHPNNKGYEKVALAIQRLLKKSGAI
jgi:lysophospholipase L1-like esterase